MGHRADARGSMGWQRREVAIIYRQMLPSSAFFALFPRYLRKLDRRALEKSWSAGARSHTTREDKYSLYTLRQRPIFSLIGFGPGGGRYLAMQPKCDPDRYTNLTGAPHKGYGRLLRDPTPLKKSNAPPIRSGSDQSFLSQGLPQVPPLPTALPSMARARRPLRAPPHRAAARPVFAPATALRAERVSGGGD